MSMLENKFLEIESEMKEISTGNYTIIIVDPEEFKNHSLPLARIKKIMKLDDEVKVEFSYFI